MAEYKVTLDLYFDTEVSMSFHNDVTQSIVHAMCPRSIGLDCEVRCINTDCGDCWKQAVERGAVANAGFIHVRRLD